MKLSIIIVNYNVRYFLEQALQSVRKAARGLEVEIFVVDNNSVDDSVAMVREKFPDVTLIVNDDNPGFSVANNQAIRQSTGEYVLLLNPDTVIEEDTLTKCIRFMDEHPETGGLGVRMIDGSGRFLPESKRGFPSPFVAFTKAVGLSRLFPKSRLFNHYSLGYLDEFETNEVDILAGAFMWLRRSALDKAGLLDEDFFMYGEDIDLSYRLTQAGYKNVYFPETTILHYKGESTKKGSLNYVKSFYNAMIIFARKHFAGNQQKAFVLMLQIAIYLKAFTTLLGNFVKTATLPIFDAVVIYGGLFFLMDFWANYNFQQADYFSRSNLYLNFPLYTGIWVSAIYLSGGYDAKIRLGNVVRGLLLGTIVLTAIYGLLNPEYRSSRVLIMLGAAWSLLATLGVRILLNFAKTGSLDIGQPAPKNLVIVGSLEESQRVQYLLHQMQLQTNFIGTVAPTESNSKNFLSSLLQLQEISHIYNIDEIIFCGKDVSVQDILRWMSRLGTGIEYKIIPDESISVIGSSNKNKAGELYTIDIKFRIAEKDARRNKRLMDLALSLFLLLTLPLQLLVVKNKKGFISNLSAVFFGKKSWVDYAYTDHQPYDLPALKKGVLTPLDRLDGWKSKTRKGEAYSIDKPTVDRLNFLYAKDYRPSVDLEIFWKGRRQLGRRNSDTPLPPNFFFQL
ncbi:MAG: glycosyltransferase [Gammaproteobacteria bacterium]|nr:glycosyltransferase [Gammaproteobacteria bacterium]